MGRPGLLEADKSAVTTGGVRSPGVLTVPPIRESQNSAAHHVDRPMAVCRCDAQLYFGGAHTAFNGWAYALGIAGEIPFAEEDWNVKPGDYRNAQIKNPP